MNAVSEAHRPAAAPSAPARAMIERLVAFKNVTVNEEFFQGHFPGAPLLPAVLMLESLSQVAAILLLLAVINIVGGALTVLSISAIGLLSVIEGLITALLGLMMLTSSADVHYMGETKFAAIHLGNAFQNLSVFYKSQYFLAVFLIGIAVIRLVVG